MNNWRLLLLAVVVVVQPIRSFTESNLIDGRDWRRSTQVERRGYQKNEESRLSSVDGKRGERYESFRDPMLMRSERESLKQESSYSPDLSSRATFEIRFARDRRQHRATPELRQTREIDENRDEFRRRNNRNSEESRNRYTVDATRTIKPLRDAIRDNRIFERGSRNFVSRLPIRVNRNIEDRSFSASREETETLKREREDVARSDSRRGRINASVRPERIQLDDNSNRWGNDRRTREDGNQNRLSRFYEGRVNEIRTAQDERTVELNEWNNRHSRVATVRPEITQQRKTELRDRVNAVRHDSERDSEDTLIESRAAKIVRDRMYARSNGRSDEGRQRDEIRRLDTLRERNTVERRLDSHPRSFESERRQLSMIREFRDSNRNIRDVRTTSNRDTKSSDERRLQRENNRLARDRTVSSLREVRDNTENQQESRRIETRRESYVERREQRDNSRLTREKKIPSLYKVPTNNEMMQESRRESTSRRDRTINLVRDNREDSTRRQETRRTVSPARAYINSQVDSRIHQDLDKQERNERRQALERGMELRERNNNMARDSNSAEQRRENRESSRPSRLINDKAPRIREDTILMFDERRQTRDQDRTIEKATVQREVRTPQRLYNYRPSRTESIRLEQNVRNRDDVREKREHVRSNERSVRVVEREARNVATPQRHDTRRSSRTQSIRLERVVRNRDIRDNERRETERKELDDDRTSRIILNHQSSERVLAERRQENRDAARDSRNIRGETRNREVRIVERLDSHRQRDVSRVNERVLDEGRQETREAFKDLRIRDETRTREFKMDERDSHRHGDERRQGIRDVTRIREVRMEPRDASREYRTLFQRDADRLAEESRNTVSSKYIRATTNIERENRFDRNVRTGDVQRAVRSNIRSNNDNLAMERMERTMRLDARRNEDSRFRTVASLNFSDSLDNSEDSVSNWPMIFYTLQGIYLCGLLAQMLTNKSENVYKTKKSTWWTSPKILVKVD